jgi:hypothetical protein
VIITWYTGPDGAVAIPATIDGKPVTGIGSQAFRGCTGLTSITIPKSVAHISLGAFSDCYDLQPEVRADIKQRFGEMVFVRD